MKVCIVSTSDIHGGAAVAAFRLMEALTAQGIDTTMLVRDKRSTHPRVVQVGEPAQNKRNFYIERAVIFAKNSFSKKNLFDVSIGNTGVSISDRPEFKTADVIHLHWVNQGMLSLKEMQKIITSGKKIIWTMHDMWAFTGICHHAAQCSRFTISCGECPYLAKPNSNDISAQIFQKKKNIYSKGLLTFVACSQWLKNLAILSSLTHNQKVVSISNPLNTNIYTPRDKNTLRSNWNLPQDKKIILFAAVKASDPRKGLVYLIEAAKRLAEKHSDVLFLIAGGQGEVIARQISAPSHVLGYVNPGKMSEIYNLADVFVIPSLQENLPNTIMESMACGTPCVGFQIGGIPEMIDHHINGYVAEYKNAADLAKGLEWVLYETDTKEMAQQARHKVLSRYDEQIIAKKYIEIYKD